MYAIHHSSMKTNQYQARKRDTLKHMPELENGAQLLIVVVQQFLAASNWVRTSILPYYAEAGKPMQTLKKGHRRQRERENPHAQRKGPFRVRVKQPFTELQGSSQPKYISWKLFPARRTPAPNHISAPGLLSLIGRPISDRSDRLSLIGVLALIVSDSVSSARDLK